MTGRQLVEFLAGFGILFQCGCEFGGRGKVPRFGIELERYADQVAGIAAATGFAQRGINLQTVATCAGRDERGASGAVIHSGDDGDVFRLRLLAFVASGCTLASPAARGALHFRNQRIGNVYSHIYVPHHPDFVNRREKFLCLMIHLLRSPESHPERFTNDIMRQNMRASREAAFTVDIPATRRRICEQWMRDLSQFDRIGYWSEIKLDILRAYASAYSTILAAQKSPSLYHVYIDAFAGAGAHLTKSTAEFILGSPLNALNIRPPFREYHLIDIEPEKIESLRELTERWDNVFSYQADCNTILLEKVFPRVKYENYRRGLCILDPYG